MRKDIFNTGQKPTLNVIINIEFILYWLVLIFDD